MHNSVRMETPCEFINVTPINPLISKCQIKVCYVGDKPNRNGSVITKEVAREMANSLPGSPIVGYFNEGNGDFEEHNRTIDISNGKFEIKDTTKPYGFVDLNAKCWFQKFLDDGIEHEYLCTEGWLWTGQYPECKRIIERGNNQSMELDEKTLNAHWAKSEKDACEFFIINEAIISKLCVLGEKVEPCFEGSQITRVQFSFEDGFKQQLFSMMKELKKLLDEGGTHVFTKYSVTVGDSLWNALYSHVHGISESLRIESVCEEEGQKFAILQDGEKFSRLDFTMDDENGFVPAESMTELENYSPAEEPQFALADVEAFEVEFKKANKDEDDEEKNGEEGKTGKEGNPNSEDNSEGDGSENSDDDEDEDEKKKKKYSLEEIPEYVELLDKYNQLQASFDTLQAENATLVEFKTTAERKDKEALIEGTFYMLSDEDKADVVANIDKYSLEDIEAKLSIICVRNKVSFNLDDENKGKDPMVYNLHDHDNTETIPAWVQAALNTAKTLN